MNEGKQIKIIFFLLFGKQDVDFFYFEHPMFSTWVLCESSAVDLLATQRTSICRLCLLLPTHLLFMLICLYQYLCDHLPDRFCKSYAFLPLMLTCVIILSISSYLIYLRLQYQKCMWRPKCQKCIWRLKWSFQSVFIQRVFLQNVPNLRVF